MTAATRVVLADAILRTHDRSWLAVMALVTAVELAWWAINWSLGFAPAPFVVTSMALAFGGLGCAAALRRLAQPAAPRPNWPALFVATTLVGLGASVFLPLKSAIPHLVPFWLDPSLAAAERWTFTADPWLLLDRALAWASMPIDRLYGLWLPTQCLVLFTLLMQPPSRMKSRAVIAYVLAWLVLGVIAAALLSSAGPIFYDRMFGGSDFAALRETLERRGAWVVLAESDMMWAAYASGRPGLVAGISALPSIHVAISAWFFLVARESAPRLARLALAYAALIWIGSVQLGWHYALDGLAGVAGMAAIWGFSASVERRLETWFQSVPLGNQAAADSAAASVAAIVPPPNSRAPS